MAQFVKLGPALAGDIDSASAGRVLAAELTRAEYAGKTDAEIVAALNATAAAFRAVPIAELSSLAYAIGLPVRLRVALREPGLPADLAALCESLLDLLKAPFPTVDFFAADGTPDPATAAMLGALIGAKLLTEAEQAALAGLAMITQPSRAEALGLGNVTVGDIATARKWQQAQRAEADRLVAYAALRERLVNGQHAALVWLQAQQDAGAAAPAWADVLARV